MATNDEDVEEVGGNQGNVDEGDDDEITKSDIELEGDIVEPDDEPLQKMGDPSVEVTEESRDAS